MTVPALYILIKLPNIKGKILLLVASLLILVQLLPYHFLSVLHEVGVFEDAYGALSWTGPFRVITVQAPWFLSMFAIAQWLSYQSSALSVYQLLFSLKGSIDRQVFSSACCYWWVGS